MAAAIARILSRSFGIEVEADTLQPVLIFCGLGLALSLFLIAYGLDLGAGWF